MNRYSATAITTGTIIIRIGNDCLSGRFGSDGTLNSVTPAAGCRRGGRL